MAIALYARKSVERENSISCETQLEYCRAMLKPDERGEKILEFVDNGYSGGNTDREGFQKMLRQIERGKITKVIVYRLDRISRSLSDFVGILETLKRYHVKFISSQESFDTSSPYGEMIVKLLAVFAEFERQSIILPITVRIIFCVKGDSRSDLKGHSNVHTRDVLLIRRVCSDQPGCRAPFDWFGFCYPRPLHRLNLAIVFIDVIEIALEITEFQRLRVILPVPHPFCGIVYEEVILSVAVHHGDIVFIDERTCSRIAICVFSERGGYLNRERSVISTNGRTGLVVKGLIYNCKALGASSLYTSASCCLYLIVGRVISVYLVYEVLLEKKRVSKVSNSTRELSVSTNRGCIRVCRDSHKAIPVLKVSELASVNLIYRFFAIYVNRFLFIGSPAVL